MIEDSAVARARSLLDGFGRHLQACRKHHQVPLRELAAMLGVKGLDAAVLTRIESARWCPTPDQERAIVEWVLQHPLPDDQTERDQ